MSRKLNNSGKGSKAFINRFTKRDVVKVSVLFLFSVILVSLENTFLSSIGIFGIPPDTVLPLVIAITFFTSSELGGVFGLSAGIICSGARGEDIWIYPCLYVLIGYFAGKLTFGVTEKRFASYMLYTVISSVFVCVIKVIMRSLFTPTATLTYILIKNILPEIIETVAFSMVIYPIVRAVFKNSKNQKK